MKARASLFHTVELPRPFHNLLLVMVFYHSNSNTNQDIIKIVISKKLKFPHNPVMGKEKSRSLVSVRDSQQCARETGTELCHEQGYLVMYTSCPLFESKLYVRTKKMDSRSPLPNVATLDKSSSTFHDCFLYQPFEPSLF